MFHMQLATLIGSSPSDSVRLMIQESVGRQNIKSLKIIRQLQDFGYDFDALEEAILEGEGQVSVENDLLVFRKGEWESKIRLTSDSRVEQITTIKLS